MKKLRFFPNQNLSGGIVFLIFFVLANPLWAEMPVKPIVYVWEFITSDGQKNDLTRNLTEEFEETLIKCGCFTVLERRDYVRIIDHKDNEKAIAEIESVSTKTLDSLHFYLATIVVFGKVYYDNSSGEIKITLIFQKFDSTKKMWSTRLKMEKALFPKEREKAMKKLVKEICPNPKHDNKWLLGLSIISHSITAIYFTFSANHFGDKAEDEFKNIPPVLSEERVRTVGEFKKYQTREYWYYWAAVNSAVTALPFLFDLINSKPRIGKRSSAGLFLVCSAAFATGAMFSRGKANDTYKEIKSKYLPLSEERVKHWGKYKKYLEKEECLYFNALIDLITTGEILGWYNRDDEDCEQIGIYLDSKKSTRLSFIFNNNNRSYTYRFGVTLQKSF